MKKGKRRTTSRNAKRKARTSAQAHQRPGKAGYDRKGYDGTYSEETD